MIVMFMHSHLCLYIYVYYLLFVQKPIEDRSPGYEYVETNPRFTRAVNNRQVSGGCTSDSGKHTMCQWEQHELL